MENKKNKKKLFAIIGASALAFILTIALSVSITLAYFGSTGTGASSVTLGGSVVVGDALTMNGNVTGAVPGQVVDLSVKASITSSSTQKAAVILLVKQVNGADVKIDGVTGWTKSTTVATIGADKYTVYVYGTEDAMTVVDLTSTASEVAFGGKYTIPTTLTNDDADKAVADAQVNATVVAIQNGTENLATAKAFTALQTIFADVAGCTFA